MMVNGRFAKSMVREQISLLMAINTLVNIKMESLMVKEYTLGRMDLYMKEIFSMVLNMVREHGEKIKTNSTLIGILDNTNLTRSMVTVSSNGHLVMYTRDSM
jgi:hypothetical protein